jgi:hypothetical protein
MVEAVIATQKLIGKNKRKEGNIDSRNSKSEKIIML